MQPVPAAASEVEQGEAGVHHQVMGIVGVCVLWMVIYCYEVLCREHCAWKASLKTFFVNDVDCHMLHGLGLPDSIQD